MTSVSTKANDLENDYSSSGEDQSKSDAGENMRDYSLHDDIFRIKHWS